ncbi:putative transcription factor interactor and regulator CCHC(Zn) family [Helianthus annuus]|nr:putative transcription factor interactor and regulator CCHC(Zn) family [Helianthus annuus]
MSSNNSELTALNQQQELDSKLGTTTRIPRLTDANDFPEWKWRFEQHLKVKDYKLWRSILRGPREIMMESSTEPGLKVKKPRDQYTEDDLLIVEEDDRALSYLTMGLGPDIAIGFRTCKSAKELWDSLIEVYEGNEDMKESRRNLLQQNFNNFNHIYGETVDNQIQRFVKLITQMQMEEIHTTNASTNRQLLNALPKSWDHHVAMIKKTKDLARCTLSEMISHIKACELDDKQRETNYKNSMLAAGFSIAPASSNNSNTALLSQGGFQMFRNTSSVTPTSAKVHSSGSSNQVVSPASPASIPNSGNISTAASASAANNEMIAFFAKQSKENLDIAASVINCLNAFIAGKLDPPKWSPDDLTQIHPDDVEEMDITWQMAMAAFRAQKFVKRTGKNRWGNAWNGAAKVPFNLRCFNCHEEGHYARNCPQPLINRDQTPATPAQPATPNRERALVTTTSIADAAASGSPQPQGLAQALVVQPNLNFDWTSEIERLNISAPENQTATSNIAFMTSSEHSPKPEEETAADDFAFMTQILSAPVKGLTKEEVISVFCTPACRERVEAYRIHNAELIQDYNDIKNKNFTLSKNEKLYKEKIEAQRKDIIKLKDDVSVKTAHFLEAQEKVCILTKELEDIRNRYQINELNIKKFDSSSKLVKNLCDQQIAFKEKKGRGLGYTQTPPPYNDNYTYLPMTEEEMLNESKMTYGSKNHKSSVHDRHVEPQKSTPLNFVHKDTIDPNVSSSCADDSSEVKCDDVHGSEPVIISNVSEPYFEHYSEPTESDIAFTSSLFASFSTYVSSSNVCDPNISNVSACENLTGEVPQDAFSETTETTSQENQEYPDSSSESVSVGVPNVESSGTPLETELNNEPETVLHDQCSEEMHIDETSSRSEKEPDSVSHDKCIEEEHIVETSFCSGSEPESVSYDKCLDKTHLDETRTCSNSESRLSENEKDADLREKSLKENLSKEKPQVKSSKSSEQSQVKHVQKIKTSNHTKSSKQSQNVKNIQNMKRQTCFNCGIAGHIARNCGKLPRTSNKKTSGRNQKVTYNRYHCSESMMSARTKTMKNNYHRTRPSDQDWNAAKRYNQYQNRQTNFQCNRSNSFGNAFENFNANWSRQFWKPKANGMQSNSMKTCHQNVAKRDVSKFLNKENLVWQRVTYIDAQGKPRSTMGWVPKSN